MLSLSSANTIVFYSLVTFSIAINTHFASHAEAFAENISPASIFLRPEPRDGYRFFSRCGIESLVRAHSFKRVRGRCGAFTPLGRVAEKLKGSKRGRDAKSAPPHR